MTRVERDDDGFVEDSTEKTVETVPTETQPSTQPDPGQAVVAGPATGAYKLNWKFPNDPLFYSLVGDKFVTYGGAGYGFPLVLPAP